MDASKGRPECIGRQTGYIASDDGTLPMFASYLPIFAAYLPIFAAYQPICAGNHPINAAHIPINAAEHHDQHPDTSRSTSRYQPMFVACLAINARCLPMDPTSLPINLPVLPDLQACSSRTTGGNLSKYAWVVREANMLLPEGRGVVPEVQECSDRGSTVLFPRYRAVDPEVRAVDAEMRAVDPEVHGVDPERGRRRGPHLRFSGRPNLTASGAGLSALSDCALFSKSKRGVAASKR